MVGGKDHTTHHLAYSGKSDRQVWMIFFVLGLISTLIACTMIYAVLEGGTFLVLSLSLYFPLVFISLYRYTIRFKEPLR